ncbi:hypothetical protein CMUST_15150 [Corynebacterium mustelae]|uniref:Uncharacterized protein n=1 Tax=Corynebacterium mustelae TaxID=571915 RepID=A0A0G3H1M8_9CORY|nr:hypothetical protein CMUST_15150 [Corynebacterium mustelae]
MGFQGEVERFFQQVWDTICAALPVDESIIDQESRNIVHNEDKGIWVGEFAVPLAHPVNGQSKVADFRE